MKILNPVKMMSKLMKLLLSRPLNAKSLMQRLIEIIVDERQTGIFIYVLYYTNVTIARMLRHNKQILGDKELCKRVNAWVEQYYHPEKWEGIIII
jgi:hypothetical protein